MSCADVCNDAVSIKSSRSILKWKQLIPLSMVPGSLSSLSFNIDNNLPGCGVMHCPMADSISVLSLPNGKQYPEHEQFVGLLK